MLLYELTEANLPPDHEYLALIGEILDEASAEYAEFLKGNNDQDDVEELADILQSYSDAEELNLDWHVGETDSIIGNWGPKSFKDSVLKTLAHETIHLAQRDKMGAEKYNTLPSGYMQGLKKAKKSGKEQDMIRTYFRDPQELMAHGHDLAQEILASSNPEDALRNPEKYRNELPSYDKHRAIFPPNAKPLQKLLSYAAGYVNEKK